MLPDALINHLLWARMSVYRWTHWRPFVEAAKHPARTQRALLQDILHRNRSTDFGREHGFDRIETYDDYAAAVPVQTYETLRPYIEEQERTGRTTLNAEPPVMYAQTSGTTGQPKLVPLLARSLDAHKRSQSLQAYVQFRTDPKAYYGKLLGVVSPAEEGRLESGTPFGSASGHVYKNMPKLARQKYVVPHQVFAIEDYELKYLVILRLALVHRDVTFLGSANPSTFLKLASVLARAREELLEDIRKGGFRHLDRLESDVRAAVEPRLPCTADRTRELETLLSSPAPTIAQLWPRLRLVNTWTGGSCGIALAAVRQHLPPDTRVAELGYLSSEFRGSIIVDVDRHLGAPTLHENFFELVDVDAWDRGEARPVTPLTIDALEENKSYYVIVTTGAGLYRYFMNDIITVTGRFHETPTIRFVQKGKGVTNITGEKLYESQVLVAVQAADAALGARSPFFLMFADAERATYRLVIELAAESQDRSRLRDLVETELFAMNAKYRTKRDSGRLAPLELVVVAPGTGEAYKRHCLASGQREGQFKVMALQYQSDCEFPFDDFYTEGHDDP